MTKRVVVFIALMIAAAGGTSLAQSPVQSQLSPAKAQESRKYPQIVAYTVAWCPHCREAKEYFTHNNIPFINRDVELDEKAMATLTGTYKSQGVPVIVIGTGADEIVLKGFSPESFSDALQKARTRMK